MNHINYTWAAYLYWFFVSSNAGLKGYLVTVIILFTPNGKVHRLITRLAYKNLLHPFQPDARTKKLSSKNCIKIRYQVNTISWRK